MKFDVIVIGGGPGGAECSRVLARRGKKVALVENREIGGICLNRGCIPAKTMLYSAEMFRTGMKISDYGIKFCQDEPAFDFDRMIEKRREIMQKLRKGLTFLIEKDGVEIIRGFGEVIGDNKIRVGDDEYEADFIVLATGGDARKFPGYDEDDDRFLVSDNIFDLTAFPESILIVGGGPVGTEFATFFKTFGIEVHILDMASTFLNFYDHDLGNELIKNFKKDGIHVYTETLVEEIDSSGKNLVCKLSNGDTIEVEKILSAIGMSPKTEYLNESNVNVSEKGRIEVDDQLRTSVNTIYALGDANGRSGTAYGAEREGLYIAHHILGHDLSDISLDYASFPDVVFTDPEVGSCGMSEGQCREKDIDCVSGKVQFIVNGKAQIKGDTRGFCKIVADKDTGIVLGVHIIGPTATEIIHTAVIPVRDGMTVDEWLNKVWGHPVLAEIVKEALVDVREKLNS